MDEVRIRVKWIDIAKGITIIFVVMGHTIQAYCQDLDILFKIIYSFHMPAFFIISGLTFSWNGNLWEYTKKKTKVLLIPYVSFVAVTILYDIFVAILKGNLSVFVGAIKSNLIHTVLATSESYFKNLWFLPCLFVSLIMLYLIFNLIHSDAIRGGVCIGLCTISYIARTRFNLILPLCGEIAAVDIVWIFAGYKIKDYLQKEKKENFVKILILCIILFIVTNAISCSLSKSADSYRQLKFSNIAISCVTGLSGTLFIVFLSKLIEKNTILEYLGKNSNWIYGMHFLLLGLLGIVLKHIPFVNKQSIVRVCIGTVLNLLIVMIWYRIKIHVKKKTRRNKYENNSYCTNETE